MRRNQIHIMAILVLVSFMLWTHLVPAIAKATEARDEMLSRLEKSLNISMLEQEPETQIIKCFDVNENGWFAIGTRRNQILVYDRDGVYQYGFRFEPTGTYGISFVGDNVSIFLSRGDTIAVVNSTGNCIHAEEVTLSNSLREAFLKQTVKLIGNVKYYLERDIGIFDGAYSRLAVIDEDGNRTVLYDATVKGYFEGALHYIILLGCLLIGIGAVVSKVREEERDDDCSGKAEV